jgi:aryl-alcohol dehydrogenase-like predicted oxidoreductase
MPLGVDQGVSAIVWSPLASGRLTGKIRRGLSVPEGSRRGLRPEDGPFVEDGHLFTIIEAIDEIARATGKSVTQIALNWLRHPDRDSRHSDPRMPDVRMPTRADRKFRN